MEGVVIALFLGVPLVIVSLLAYLSWRRRRVFLSRLPALAAAGLEDLAERVLDNPTIAQTDSEARLEGKRNGEDVRLTTDFGPVVNQQYLANNMLGAIVTEMKVTVGLRGATPRFAIRAIPGAQVHYGEWPPTITDLEEAWVFEMDEKLASTVIDEAIGRELMRLREACPGVKSITADPSGLTITWTVPAGVTSFYNTEPLHLEQHQASVAAATDVALALQSRILDVLEDRVRLRVGIGYRGPEPLEDEEQQQEEVARADRR